MTGHTEREKRVDGCACMCVYVVDMGKRESVCALLVDTCGGGTFSFLLTFTFTWGLGLTKNHLKTSPRKKKRNTQPHPALDPPAQRGSKKKSYIGARER